jgi:hypothetical protein
MSSKTPFPYPLQLGALEEFCHPATCHLLSAPHVTGSGRDSAVLAGNGYLAIRVSRGLWMDSDFSPAPPGFFARLEKLPWGRHGDLPAGDWRAMHDVRPSLFRKPPISPWLGARVAPSPVCCVAERHRIRLHHLQLISRLPRCEIWCGDATVMEPLFFRFSSGAGIIAWDKSLHDPKNNIRVAVSIFNPRRCPITGQRVSS